MVGRPAVDPVRQMHGGVARVVERDADYLIETGIVRRAPIHLAATDRRTRGFCEAFMIALDHDAAAPVN